jgi:hypothetical protein
MLSVKQTKRDSQLLRPKSRQLEPQRLGLQGVRQQQLAA